MMDIEKELAGLRDKIFLCADCISPNLNVLIEYTHGKNSYPGFPPNESEWVKSRFWHIKRECEEALGYIRDFKVIERLIADNN